MMLGWITLLIAAVLVVVSRIAAAKILPHPVISKQVTVMLVLLLILGGILGLYASSDLKQAREKSEWLKTSGIVVESGLTGNGATYPEVVYSYIVDGTTFLDTTHLQAPGFGNRARQLEVAEKLITGYPVGAEVTVYYNPANVSESVLKTTPNWNVYGKFGLGVLLFAVSLFFLVLPRQAGKATE